MMTRHTISAFAILAVLAGCGTIRESRVNPFNWFGKDRVETITEAPDENADNRPRVDQVVTLRAEQVAGGAIVRAVGLPQTQGYYDASLVPVATDDRGVLNLEFRIIPPLTPTRQGTQSSREVSAALFVSNQDMAGITRIRVQGTRNARTVRR
jgi:hypothetical protein